MENKKKETLVIFLHTLAFISLVITLCLVLPSCAGKKIVRREKLKPYTGPVNIDTLKHSAGFANLHALSSGADVRVYKQGEPAGRYNGVFSYKEPGNVRLALFGPFGLTALDIIISKRLFQAYIPSKKIIYEWSNQYIGFGMPDGGNSVYKMAEEGDMFALYVYSSAGRHELASKYFFDRTYLLNRSVSFYEANEEVIHINFDDFYGGIPSRIKMTFRRNTGIEILLDDIEINSNIPDSYFNSFSHEGVEVMPFQEVLSHFSRGS